MISLTGARVGLAATAVVLTAVAVAAAGSTQSLDAQRSLYDRGKQRWLAFDYPNAYEPLILYRKQPYGRRAEVDYMLGTSGCRMADRRRWGFGVLDWMFYAYPLTHDSRRVVAHERDLCRTSIQGLASARPSMIDEAIAAGMTARGKSFHWVDRDIPVSSYPIRRTRDIERAVFETRLTPLGDPDDAVVTVRNLAPRMNVAVHEPFVIASASGHSKDEMNLIAERLERYLVFLETEYQVLPPDHYITVYLVPDIASLREFADEIHGLDVSPSTIGYAFRDDQSLIAVVPGNLIGTLFHELFHLAVRGNFGDIPQWLDEGIAGLYEVSVIAGDHVYGRPNWRGEVLQELWHERSTLEELIRAEWFPFDSPDQDKFADYYPDTDEARKQAADMALARYFALYLQEQGNLSAVYGAFRDRGLQELKGDARDHAVELVEDTLGRPMADVDRDFANWFRRVRVEGLPERPSPDVTILREQPSPPVDIFKWIPHTTAPRGTD